jgi:hypothetical protein
MCSDHATRREKAITALHEAVDELRRGGAAPGDRDAVARAIAAACDSEGISPQEYAAIIAADPDLQELERAALDEGLEGAADPGPYGAISRESMSGKPGDLSKSRWNPDTPRGANRG